MKSHSQSKQSSIIIGDYKVKQTIGKGTFSKVRLGIYNPTGEKVAIKILEKSKMVEKDDKERTIREMEIIKKLNHPNVVRIYEILETQKNYYIVMEYCEGGELFNYIVKNRRLDDEEASFFFYQIINGLEYIHSLGIVHRDLKPENLLLGKDKTLKIIDFGLSNYFNKKLLSTPCGSPCYASPEMVSGHRYNGFKIDVWSCGIILYAMLCGYLPFEDKDNEILFKTIRECDVEYPSSLSDMSKNLMKRILVTNPEKRITIPEIKRHSFYLKGERIYNMKFKSRPCSNKSTSRAQTQRENKILNKIYADYRYATIKTEADTKRENKNKMTLAVLSQEEPTPSILIKYETNPSKTEEERDSKPASVPKQRMQSSKLPKKSSEKAKQILHKTLNSNLYQPAKSNIKFTSNKIKKISLSGLMNLNSVRISSQSPAKPATMKHISTGQKRPSNPNSIMIKNAVINFNMFEPNIYFSQQNTDTNRGKPRQRTKSAARPPKTSKNLTLLNNLIRNLEKKKNGKEKIVTAHQKYMHNICHTDFNVKPTKKCETVTDGSSDASKNNNKKVLTNFFENYKTSYLLTDFSINPKKHSKIQSHGIVANNLKKSKENPYKLTSKTMKKNDRLEKEIKVIEEEMNILANKEFNLKKKD